MRRTVPADTVPEDIVAATAANLADAAEATVEDAVEVAGGAIVGEVGSRESSCFFEGNQRLTARRIVTSFPAVNSTRKWVRATSATASWV